ncbi:acetyl/propionyl/methylcrotonyl-CoA carboxylase subunit alpha [Ferrimonas aestuarii]|uniref:Biotin carboxylase n=1 Tax=Ferrimonas aestuarii TaxID=2569539 RepID=A0A4U1BQI6_9GAMM|nr:biotin carboxylase N-terminal domain-containing protein [Ferrimonas aestuarii]TKB57277.1 ATP-grasp domain-containing protein [Ferrimonas aestuarii]
MAFTTVLIANRGEIAVRIIRTVQQLGFDAVAIYSDSDRHSPMVTLADSAVYLGADDLSQSYLNIDAIIDAAKRSGADAIHPGYGFLSENADFARRCQEQGITFIGPNPETIALMASKRLAKIAMEQAGVPCIPGYQGINQTDDALINKAQAIGFPVMIKASAGGGGRGMRLVETPEDLVAALTSARAEAKSGFGDDELILEKALTRSRHIEVQIFGDGHGNVVHLGERDCSIQRRHQKVIEEAPSPAVNAALREQLGAAAVLAGQSCQYLGAGTVEFLLDDNNQFYFLEMNTRLQVEHPVTELITGQDLVAWQLKLAAGEPIPLSQSQIPLSGHAIEVRLYAEAPSQGFCPQTGSVLHWAPYSADGIRVDHGLVQNQPIGSQFDPMLAKVIAYGDDREQARCRLIRALKNTSLLGVHTNAAMLINLLNHEVFRQGEATTGFIETEFGSDPSLSQAVIPSWLWALAACVMAQQPNTGGSALNLANPSRLRLKAQEDVAELQMSFDSSGWRVTADGQQHQINLSRDGAAVHASIDGLHQKFTAVNHGQQLWLGYQGQTFQFEEFGYSQSPKNVHDGDGVIRSAMDGVMQRIEVDVNDRVSKGQTLGFMEAMKMEMPLIADGDGIIRQILAQPGQQVKRQQPLIEITHQENDHDHA